GITAQNAHLPYCSQCVIVTVSTVAVYIQEGVASGLLIDTGMPHTTVVVTVNPKPEEYDDRPVVSGFGSAYIQLYRLRIHADLKPPQRCYSRKSWSHLCCKQSAF